MTLFSQSVLRPLICVSALMLAVLPATAAQPDKLLPDDTQGVVHVNVREVLDSPFIKKNALSTIENLIKDNLEVAFLLQQINFDPLKDASSLTVAMKEIKLDNSPGGAGAAPRPAGPGLPNLPQPQGDVVLILRGNFDLPQIQSVVTEFNKNMPGKLTTSEHAGVKVYAAKNDDKENFMAFVDRNTLVLGSKKEVVTSAIDQSQGKKTSNLNKPLARLLEKVDDKKAAWLAFPIPDAVRQQLKSNPQGAMMADKLEGIIVEVSPKDDLVGEISVLTNDPMIAQQLKQTIDGFKFFLAAMAMQQDKDFGPAIAEVVNTMRTSVKGNVASARLTVPSKLIEKAMKGASENKDKEDKDK
jgi:hypothetical protein